MPHLLTLLVLGRPCFKLLSCRLRLLTLLIWRRSKLHLSCCDCRACHFLKRFLVYAWPGLNPRALFGDRRKLDGVAKGRDDRFTHLVNGEIAHDDALLVLKGTHWFLLFGASSLAICITKCLLIRLVP